MKIVWQIEPEDIEKVQGFFELHRGDPLVQKRIKRNLSETKPQVSKRYFWYVLVSCLLTTQQRSGSNSPVTRFISTKPFPLSYELCMSQDDLRVFAQDVISSSRGIRFSNRLSDQIAGNLDLMERGLWDKTSAMLGKLRLDQTLQGEKKAANFKIVTLKVSGRSSHVTCYNGLA